MLLLLLLLLLLVVVVVVVASGSLSVCGSLEGGRIKIIPSLAL